MKISSIYSINFPCDGTCSYLISFAFLIKFLVAFICRGKFSVIESSRNSLLDNINLYEFSSLKLLAQGVLSTNGFKR